MLIHQFVPSSLEHEGIDLALSENAPINQYQHSWLIFIGLVVMISACQE
jgi:hypothetical protein